MIKQTIPNWAIFGASYIGLGIYMIKDKESGKVMYQVAYEIFLDDGTVKTRETDQHIAILTDIAHEDKNVAISEGVYSLTAAFSEISSTVFIFNEESDIIEEVDLHDFDLSMNDDDSEIETYSVKTEKSDYLH